jgi:signal transduction histidine kinase
MSRRLRAALIGGAVAAATFNVVTFYVNGWPLPPNPAIYVITSTLVLLAYLVVGLIAWQVHPGERIGLLFTITGYAWLLPSLTNLHYALPFTVGNVTPALYQACLAHLALAWPYGRLRSRLDRVVVATNYCWNIGNNAVSILFWNPRTNGCGTACPANLFLLGSSNRLHSDLSNIGSIVGIGITVTVVALITAHWRSSRGYARRAMTHLIWVALPIAAYIGLLEIPSSLGLSNLVLYGIGPLILITAPAAYAIGLFRTRSARGAVGAALMDLEPGPAPARLRDALAKALGDPTLQLAFRVPDRGCYIDTGDLAVDADLLPAGRMLTPLDPGADAVLVHDDELRHEPELVRVAAAAANLALEHSRLQAEIQTQLEQVRASRARIVEAGDTARRRLERDLHDGAQQRLVTLSLALGMARSQAAGSDPELEALLESATKEAREALVELRELARGLHPAVLTETGLPGAIQSLVERSPVATTVTAVPTGRFPPPIEATTYFVVSEALANVAKHAPAATAKIAIRQLAGQIVVEVSDDGPGGAQADAGSGLRGLADRVASVGGALQIDSPSGRGTRLKAEIPCQLPRLARHPCAWSSPRTRSCCARDSAGC